MSQIIHLPNLSVYQILLYSKNTDSKDVNNLNKTPNDFSDDSGSSNKKFSNNLEMDSNDIIKYENDSNKDSNDFNMDSSFSNNFNRFNNESVKCSKEVNNLNETILAPARKSVEMI